MTTFTPNIYDIGDVAHIQGRFSIADVGTDPTEIKCYLRHPDDSVEEILPPTLVHDGDGVFSADVSVDAAGTWRYRFTGTGEAEASEERWFFVRRRLVPDPEP